MKFYLESFNGDEFEGYAKTDITPEQIIQYFGTHPVEGMFQVTPEVAEHFGLQLDQNYEYFLGAIRDYPDETYEYMGVKLYPPPMFLPENLNADPIKPK